MFDDLGYFLVYIIATKTQNTHREKEEEEKEKEKKEREKLHLQQIYHLKKKPQGSDHYIKGKPAKILKHSLKIARK